MREAGVIVDDKPKIYSQDIDQTNQSLLFPDINLRIPLKLNGIFSYFETQAPTRNEIEHCDMTFITPDSNEWNLYSNYFALNEDAMLDWEGNITQKSWRDKTRVNEDHK